MAPAAHTSQTPASGNVDNGAAITLGVRFYAPDGATVSGIAFYAPTTNTGTYSARLWLSTAPDDSATGTLLQSGSLASGSVTPGAWNTIPLAAPVELDPDTVYTAGVHTSSGRFVLTSGAFSSAISGNGIVLIQSGDDPVGFGVSRNGVFTEGASPTFPTSTFGQSDYFIDVELDDGATIISVGTATETDTAVAFGKRKTRAVGTAAETDTALALARVKRRAVGLATSTETAMPIGRMKIRALGTADETSTAFSIARTKLRTLGLATETDTALPIAAPGVADVKGSSTPAVTAAQTSDPAVTAGRTSTAAVSAGRTSLATVG